MKSLNAKMSIIKQFLAWLIAYCFIILNLSSSWLCRLVSFSSKILALELFPHLIWLVCIHFHWAQTSKSPPSIQKSANNSRFEWLLNCYQSICIDFSAQSWQRSFIHVFKLFFFVLKQSIYNCCRWIYSKIRNCK